MNNAVLLSAVGALALTISSATIAQQVVHPTRGQSHRQQARDESHCSDWATRQTGFHPSEPPPPSVAPAPVTGSGARARGAAGGAVIGAIAGNAGAGAAAGAVAGGLIRRGSNANEANAQNAAATNAWQSRRHAWFHQRAVCLRARGYSVA